MARTFRLSVEASASVERIRSAFGDERYWVARLEAFGGNTALDSFLIDPVGTVTVITTQDLRHDVLPSLIAKVYPGDLTIRRTETWTPSEEGRVSGEITVEVTGAPASGFCTGLLVPLADGSRLDFTATVEVDVPFIGGKIEKYLGSELAKELPAVQQFTSAWAAQCPPR